MSQFGMLGVGPRSGLHLGLRLERLGLRLADLDDRRDTLDGHINIITDRTKGFDWVHTVLRAEFDRIDRITVENAEGPR